MKNKHNAKDLQPLGTAMLSGVYAHATKWVYTNPSGPWHFRKDGERHILVPGAARDTRCTQMSPLAQTKRAVR
jgi:hypothetical protein